MPDRSGVSIENLSKSYGTTPVLSDLNLEIREGEFLTLLGPSGCGKSTLLRLIAGLDRQDRGTIRIGERTVDHLAPKERDVAMVFQTYALYPNLTVSENIGLPLQMRRLTSLQRLPFIGRLMPRARSALQQIDCEVREAAALLKLEMLLDRKPGQLSGGQRQRVALGRAIVRHPSVFLMDEPLSNLDGKLRAQMRLELASLHRRLGITFIYVTHDHSEAMTLSSRVALMIDGALLQVAPPAEIYADPQDARVAEFIGSPPINMLSCTSGNGQLDIGGTRLAVTAATARRAGIRPEDVRLARKGAGTIAARIDRVEHLGAEAHLYGTTLATGEAIVARVTPAEIPSIGSERVVHLAADVGKLLLFDTSNRRVVPAIAGAVPA